MWVYDSGYFNANFFDGDDYIGGVGGADNAFAITFVGDGVTGNKSVVVTQQEE